MSCSEYLELISLYFDNEIDIDDEQRLFDHIEKCPKCKQEFEDMKNILGTLKDTPMIDLPDGFHDELIDKLRDTKIVEISSKFNQRKVWKKYTALAASFVAIFVIGGSLMASGIINSFNNKDTTSAAVPENMDMNRSRGTMNMSEQNMDYGIATGKAPENEQALSEENGTLESRVYQEDSISEENTSGLISERKIVKNYYINIEVSNFDDFLENVRKLAEENGGYVDSFNSGIYYSDSAKSINLKNGNISIRLPQESCIMVKENISTLGKVKDQSESSEDITSQYVDTQGRLNAKKLEEERLLDILSKCETVEDIIKVEERLGYIRADIEAYTSSINNWDKLVNFSTLNISVTEIGNTELDKISPDFGQKMKNSFIESFNIVIDSLQNFSIKAVRYSMPTLIIIVIIVVIILIIKGIIKKCKK